MGSVYRETRTKRWYVSYLFEGRLHRRAVSDYKGIAKTVLRRIENEIANAQHDPKRFIAELRGHAPGEMTFGKLVESFLATYRSRKNTDYYRMAARSWLQFLGPDTPLQEVTVLRVQEYRNWLQTTHGPSTVRKALVSLSTLYGWAMGVGLASANPANPKKVKRPPEPKSRNRALTDEEYTRLLEVSPNWLAAIIQWACATGLDLGVVARLRWSDLTFSLDPRDRVVSGRFKVIRPKTAGAASPEAQPGRPGGPESGEKGAPCIGGCGLPRRGWSTDSYPHPWALD
ncbi:MAG: site-specific integrase, partial [Chloroflexi bacterium]|nr:site-specific integrase [Chloroflexota bacterium]